ncbi:hypothetical protein RHECIAT_CH0003121 [Rhizobium etli CIAT 652]|uniref:Uncharacterized protein n=1 Tax=Rhizobium etli (strain CIAT 652) TaxID=491916 RepID=B3PUI8_RHIE6|nr:hypothetical protein RHECIAT_CH0003121 [Rhizobium etli CIAT 652]KKZ86262.1 hypothetical protein RPHASCH2410_CH17370 [Rhizobium phaseoli Ch24-10]
MLPPARRAEAQAGGYLQRHPCEAAPGVGMVLRSGIALLRSNLLRCGSLFKLQKNNDCRKCRFLEVSKRRLDGRREDESLRLRRAIITCFKTIYSRGVKGGSLSWRCRVGGFWALRGQ